MSGRYRLLQSDLDAMTDQGQTWGARNYLAPTEGYAER
jgi:hypothetical protein